MRFIQFEILFVTENNTSLVFEVCFKLKMNEFYDIFSVFVKQKKGNIELFFSLSEIQIKNDDQSRHFLFVLYEKLC